MMIECCLKRKNGNELFGNSREFTNFEGFSSDESEERETKNICEKKNKIRWTKEVNKIVMRFFYQNDSQKESI